MRRACGIAWVIVVVCGAGGIAVAARDCRRARGAAAAEIDRFDSTLGQARTLLGLRSSGPLQRADAEAERGLAPAVSGALASGGLAATTLTSLAPETESMGAAGLAVQRRRATLTLTPITLPQLGGFLEAWERSQPGWVPSAIEVAPDAGRPATPGADLPLRAVVVVESTRLSAAGDRP